MSKWEQVPVRDVMGPLDMFGQKINAFRDESMRDLANGEAFRDEFYTQHRVARTAYIDGLCPDASFALGLTTKLLGQEPVDLSEHGVRGVSEEAFEGFTLFDATAPNNYLFPVVSLGFNAAIPFNQSMLYGGVTSSPPLSPSHYYHPDDVMHHVLPTFIHQEQTTLSAIAESDPDRAKTLEDTYALATNEFDLRGEHMFADPTVLQVTGVLPISYKYRTDYVPHVHFPHGFTDGSVSAWYPYLVEDGELYEASQAVFDVGLLSRHSVAKKQTGAEKFMYINPEERQKDVNLVLFPMMTYSTITSNELSSPIAMQTIANAVFDANQADISKDAIVGRRQLGVGVSGEAIPGSTPIIYSIRTIGAQRQEGLW